MYKYNNKNLINYQKFSLRLLIEDFFLIIDFALI